MRALLEPVMLKRMERRIVRSFLDILILSELRKRCMSGYDIIAFIHRKFRILISSGTVYSLLYSLEREGLIQGRWNQRRRVYSLTEKGEKTIRALQNLNNQIKLFVDQCLRCGSE